MKIANIEVLKRVIKEKNSLNIVELTDLPFVPARIYWLTDLKKNAIVGSHAHKTLRQIFIPISGTLLIKFWDGNLSLSLSLSENDQPLLVDSGYWREIKALTRKSILLVLADQPYNESDYIRSKQQFKDWILNGKNSISKFD